MFGLQRCVVPPVLSSPLRVRGNKPFRVPFHMNRIFCDVCVLLMLQFRKPNIGYYCIVVGTSVRVVFGTNRDQIQTNYGLPFLHQILFVKSSVSGNIVLVDSSFCYLQQTPLLVLQDRYSLTIPVIENLESRW